MSQHFMFDLSRDWNCNSVSPFCLLISFASASGWYCCLDLFPTRKTASRRERCGWQREKKSFSNNFKSADLVKILNTRGKWLGILPCHFFTPPFYLFSIHSLNVRDSVWLFRNKILPLFQTVSWRVAAWCGKLFSAKPLPSLEVKRNWICNFPKLTDLLSSFC